MFRTLTFIRRLAVCAWLFGLAACGGPEVAGTPPLTCPGEGDYEHADVVVEAPGTVDTPAAINEPDNAVNGVVDGRPKSGGGDVFSRGLSTEPPNNFVVFEWSRRAVVDAPGADLVIFENPFETAGGVFVDPIVVEVSFDRDRWWAFDHDYTAPDESVASRDPEHWQGFAGVTPVHWNSAECTDPLADAAGGDRFDLADLAPDAPSQIRYLRLTAAPTVTNPDTGEPYPRDPLSDGFDVDGVYAADTVVR